MTRVYSHRAALNHVTPPGHPERVGRAEYVFRALDAMELDRVEAPLGTEGQIALCHPERYIAAIKSAIPNEGSRALDADTHVSPGSWEAALRAVGGAVAAVDAVLAGEVPNAFVAMRPPGHHAERETAMGFCLFGTAAIAARHAMEAHGLARVAVVDFDVHHGNGTQDLLWNEARALYVSSHQMPLYPGTGAAHERGAHDNVLNVPLPPMTGGAAMRSAYEGQVFPALDQFDPELMIISAGFDAHADDPLANLMWQAEDFAWLTRRLSDYAGGRVVSTLEGGYDLEALADSVTAHVAVLKERGDERQAG